MSILIALLIFGVLVLVHEFGHFIVARKNGITVEEFAIGMGPILLSKEHNETLYSIRLLPLGGYCKMLGEDEDEHAEGSYNTKTVLQRIAVISAGSIMNFILAFALVLFMTSVTGFSSLVVNSFTPNVPAAQEAGMMIGDRVISIDGSRLRVFGDASFALFNNHEKPIDIVVERDGVRHTLIVTPIQVAPNTYRVGFGTEYYTGVFGESVDGYNPASLPQTISHSFWMLGHYIRLVVYSVGQLFSGNVAMDDLAGPVGMVNIIDDVYQASAEISLFDTILSFMNLAALLSVNLGVMNLLPFPALDGGRLVFLFIEALRGKPMNPDREGMVHLFGFVILIGFILIVSFNDILRLFR